MDFLQQCDLIRIEDILPFFSDFVTIDHFKDAICNSLKVQNHNVHTRTRYLLIFLLGVQPTHTRS